MDCNEFNMIIIEMVNVVIYQFKEFKMTYKTWSREKLLISGQEYVGNQLIAQNASSKGYDAIINEYVYIDTQQVSEIFKIPEISFLRIRSRFVPNAPKDPYSILEVNSNAPIAEVRESWRKLVRETHPDQMIARGVPEEVIQIATKKLSDINGAWETINKEVI